MTTAVTRPSALIHEIRLEPVGDWSLFKFSESLQERLETLLNKKKADRLDAEEASELVAIGDLDRLLRRRTCCWRLAKRKLGDLQQNTLNVWGKFDADEALAGIEVIFTLVINDAQVAGARRAGIGQDLINLARCQQVRIITANADRELSGSRHVHS